MGIFDNRKKKKLLEQINAVRVDKLNNEFNNYSYKELSLLKPEEYYLHKTKLKLILDVIKILEYRPQNIDFQSFSYECIKPLLKTKSDFEKLDKLCSIYNISIIENYIISNEITNFDEVSEEIIKELIEKKKQKKEVVDFLIKNKIFENHDKILTLLEANNYLSIYNSLKEYDSTCFNNYVSSYNDYQELTKKVNYDELSAELQKKLLDYFYLKAYGVDLNISSIKDLENYDLLKKESLLAKLQSNPSSNITFFLFICGCKNEHYLESIIKDCHNLNLIAKMDSDLLKSKFQFNNEEIKLINVLSAVQSGESLIDLYNYCQNNNLDFTHIDISVFRNKIRIIYADEISNTMTKLNKEKETDKEIDAKYLGNDLYGVPLYVKEDGDFAFLVHSITKGLVLNETIRGKIGIVNTLYDNPKLWDELPREFGTIALSTSYITSNGTPFLHGSKPYVLYGFDRFNPNSIYNISNTDGKTSHATGNQEILGGYNESMNFSSELIESSFIATMYYYNEVAFNRYDGEKRIKPNFIVCFDEVNPDSINHAIYHGVPILLIKTKKYRENFVMQLEESKRKLLECNNNNLIEYYNCLIRYYINIRRLLALPSKGIDNRFLLAESKRVEDELNKANASLGQNQNSLYVNEHSR